MLVYMCVHACMCVHVHLHVFHFFNSLCARYSSPGPARRPVLSDDNLHNVKQLRVHLAN